MAGSKTRPGKQLETVHAVVKCIKNGYWIYYRHKPYHPAFVANWSLLGVMNRVERGELRLCMHAKNGMVYRTDERPR